jgi:hypothetical protein
LKLDHRSIGAFVRFWAVVNPSGQVVASSLPRPRLLGGAGPSIGIQWPGTLPNSDAKGCFSLANADGGFASVLGTGTHVLVQTYDSTGHLTPELVDVAVLCVK